MAKTYRIGDKGESVKMIQRALSQAGYMVGADGDFGQKTEAAVKAFQRQRGLSPDGIVGIKTLALLFVVSVTKMPINVHVTRMAGRKIDYIAIHYTAGSNSRPGAAKKNRDVFLKQSASADFIVDDDTIVQVTPDADGYYCWAVGDRKNVWTGGGRLYGKATNRNTISIEMCSTLRTGTSAAVPNHDGWSVSPQVMARATRLTRYLMVLYDIPRDRVVRHYDISGKLCPGIPGWNDGPLSNTAGQATSGAKSNSREWQKFIAAL